MPDEKDKPDNAWTMSTPVFRTTEGRSLKSGADSESDIPTEQANRDIPDEAVANGSQNIRLEADRHSSETTKSRKGLIVLGVVLLGALIYLVWLYRG